MFDRAGSVHEESGNRTHEICTTLYREWASTLDVLPVAWIMRCDVCANEHLIMRVGSTGADRDIENVRCIGGQDQITQRPYEWHEPTVMTHCASIMWDGHRLTIPDSTGGYDVRKPEIWNVVMSGLGLRDAGLAWNAPDLECSAVDEDGEYNL